MFFPNKTNINNSYKTQVQRDW